MDNPPPRFQPNLEYGLLGLETVVGGLAIDGAFDVIADDGGDGRMNVLELSGQPVLTTQTRGRGEFLAKVQPATGAIVAGNPAVGGVASPLFGDTPIIVTTESFSELDRLHDQVSGNTVGWLRGDHAVWNAFGIGNRTRQRAARDEHQSWATG